jgi:hypothetical protein
MNNQLQENLSLPFSQRYNYEPIPDSINSEELNSHIRNEIKATIQEA